MTTLYQVDVDRVPADPVAFAKALRVIGGTSLRDATDIHAYLVRAGGGTVVAGVELTVAEHIARELVAVGASAAVIESSVRSPSRLSPVVATKHAWKRFRSIAVV
jgi:hypothetical protein